MVRRKPEPLPYTCPKLFKLTGTRAVFLACLLGAHKLLPLCSQKDQPPREGLSSALCLPILCLDLETLLSLVPPDPQRLTSPEIGTLELDGFTETV